MDGPAIKGAAISSLVDDVARGAAEGRIAADELEARLESEDLALLDSKVNPVSWYPFEQYVRLTEVLIDLEKARADVAAFMHGRGVAAAERLIAGGVYQQLDFSTRDGRGAPQDLVRDSRLRLSLMGGLMNRGRPVVQLGDDETGTLRIELHEAAEVPDLLAHVIAGFLERCSQEGGSADRDWRARREAPDVIRFVYST